MRNGINNLVAKRSNSNISNATQFQVKIFYQGFRLKIKARKRTTAKSILMRI